MYSAFLENERNGRCNAEDEQQRAARNLQAKKDHRAHDDDDKPEAGPADLTQGFKQALFELVMVKALQLEQEWAEGNDDREHPQKMAKAGHFACGF